MRKIRFTGSAAAVTTDADRPAPASGQLLVRTELAGIGLGLVRMLNAGDVPAPGGELVGTVVSVGPDVSPDWIGKRVGGVVFEAVFDEYVLAAPQLLTEIPDGVDGADALTVVRGGLVALGVVEAARLQPGESVLITGAASGVGHLAVQLARALGASRIVAAASTSGKAGFLRECGADAVVTYAEPWGEPVDAVLDGIGGDILQAGVNALAPQGRLVAFSAGGGTLDAGTLLADLKTVTGFSIGRFGRTRPDQLDAWRAELWELLAAGRLRPRHTVLPLENLDAAVELVRSRRNQGRVMVNTAAVLAR
ncbi:quinone oxidoreductase family protein [Nocardia inohanensis]|uniref:quinone oxidoreductase family protein n=1 Tax=Nocardia inohanensis TaxID=209246 RepID=UPI00082A84BA|nr:zinc-binding dehydrogenase [Nocardia inohanensis]